MKNHEQINKFYRAIIFIFIASFFVSCASSKRIGEGEYALKKNKIEINTKKINKADIDLYIKHRPNTSKLFKKTQHVIFDYDLVEKSKSNIEEYVRQRGYYSSNISDTVIYKGKKATVIYQIKVSEPLSVGNMTYVIDDKNIEKIVFADSLHTKIKKGTILSTENLEAERDRITTNLRRNGYFNFNKTNIAFSADSSSGKGNVELKMKIENQSSIDSLGQRKYHNHKQYKIENVYIYTTRADANRIGRESRSSSGFDTVKVDNVNLIYRRSQSIDEKLFGRINLIIPGEVYNEQNVNQTFSNITNLNLFRSQRIEFSEIQSLDDEYSGLNCFIYLTPLTIQGYDLGLEVSTNSSELWGISPTLGYIHRNFLKNAERFELNLSGKYQFRVGNSQGYRRSTEFGVSTSLNLPKFLMPIQIKYFKKHIPQTKFSANYLHQQRNIYTRTIAGFSFGYEWNSSDYAKFIFNPIELRVVRLKDIAADFHDRIQKDPYVRSLYENYFSLGLNTTFIHTNQFETYKMSTHYLRLNVDVAGNTMNLFNPLLPKKDSDGKYLIFETRYSQYARADVTFVNNNIISRNAKFVYRLFAGIGRAYGNSISLPFEKMFYAGGANSLRGWQVRSIGPGSAIRDTIFSIPNQVADFRLEVNAELRFKLFWLLEGATFLDVGNIWTLNSKDARDGARFEFNNFANTIAANTGFGVRFNLSNLFTIRVDWGFKVHDPSLEHQFIGVKDWIRSKNNTIHFAINYPF